MIPVVFLHGIGGGAKSWSPQVTSFANAGYQPVPLDLPGSSAGSSAEAAAPADALLAHLGMSGQLLVQPAGAPDETHLRVRFALAGREGRELRFVDQRMFGGLSLSRGGGDLPPEIAHIARDPLDPAFDDDAFVRRVRRSASGSRSSRTS